MLWITTYITISGVLNLLILSWVYLKAKKTYLKTTFLVFITFNSAWIFCNLLMILTEYIFFFRLVHALGFLAAVFALFGL